MRETCTCGTEMRTLKLLPGGQVAYKCPHCDNPCIISGCPQCETRSRAAQ